MTARLLHLGFTARQYTLKAATSEETTNPGPNECCRSNQCFRCCLDIDIEIKGCLFGGPKLIAMRNCRIPRVFVNFSRSVGCFGLSQMRQSAPCAYLCSHEPISRRLLFSVCKQFEMTAYERLVACYPDDRKTYRPSYDICRNQWQGMQ